MPFATLVCAIPDFPPPGALFRDAATLMHALIAFPGH
jgi:hypothetical protein